MKINKWMALIILGFMLSPSVGISVAGLYLFNYSTAIIFGLWSKYHIGGYK